MALVREVYLETMLDQDGKILLDRNGEPINFPAERWVEMDVLTEEDGIAQAARDERIAEILSALDENDRQSRRPLRAVATALATGQAVPAEDQQRLVAIEAEQVALRAELAQLG